MRPFHYKPLPSSRRVIISPERLQPDRCNPAKAVLAGGFCNLLLAIIGDDVVATVTFGRDPVDGYFTLKSEIHVSLPGVDRAIASELLRNMERICPYAKMAKAGIECVITLDT